MTHNHQSKPASSVEICLYTLLGEAICKTQMLEDALGHSITLKLNSAALEVEANKSLDKQLSYTLGKAIYLAAKGNLYPMPLQSVLYGFLTQRNWLVHKTMSENKFHLGDLSKHKQLCDKIKRISDLAEKIQLALEWDMIDFCETQGRDMSKFIERLKNEKGYRPVV